MDTRTLRYVLAIARHQNLTKAAEEPFAAYLKRNPPKKSSAPDEIAEDMSECP